VTESTGPRVADVAAVERRRKSYATLSYVNSAAEVEFGRQVEIEHEFAWRQLPPQKEGSREFRAWTGFEIQTRDPELRDCTAVAAMYPYSEDWFDWGDFKPVLNRSRKERLQHLQLPMERIHAMFRSRQECRFEPLETRPGWLTARLSNPTRTDGYAITSRARSQQTTWRAIGSSMNGRHQRSGKPDLWCFGACREFERCRELLRVSPEATRLLERTADGSLFSYRKRLGPSPSLGIGPTAKGLAQAVLESSIIKALAGKSPTMERTLESGKPPTVALLVERIYDGMMYNLVKRLKEPEDGRAAGLENMEATFNERVEFFFKRFHESQPAESFRSHVEKWLAGGSDGDRIAACAALAGFHKAGFRPQRSFVGLLRPIIEDPNENPSVRLAAQTVLELIP